MAKIQNTRILFFTAGIVPTDEETDLARKLSDNVGYRNASMSYTDTVENADGVAALNEDMVPAPYAQAYPFVSSKGEVDALDKAIAKADKEGGSRPGGKPVALDNSSSVAGPGQRRRGGRKATTDDGINLDGGEGGEGGDGSQEDPNRVPAAVPPATTNNTQNPGAGDPPAHNPAPAPTVPATPTGGWNPN